MLSCFHYVEVKYSVKRLHVLNINNREISENRRPFRIVKGQLKIQKTAYEITDLKEQFVIR